MIGSTSRSRSKSNKKVFQRKPAFANYAENKPNSQFESGGRWQEGQVRSKLGFSTKNIDIVIESRKS